MWFSLGMNTFFLPYFHHSLPLNDFRIIRLNLLKNQRSNNTKEIKVSNCETKNDIKVTSNWGFVLALWPEALDIFILYQYNLIVNRVSVVGGGGGLFRTWWFINSYQVLFYWAITDRPLHFNENLAHSLYLILIVPHFLSPTRDLSRWSNRFPVPVISHSVCYFRCRMKLVFGLSTKTIATEGCCNLELL